ncbi:MAG: hypothetical protein H6698_07000 [Myxococcales bacterium]|nr:hypothetical protein [Myxococcales bacterium]MCB9531433.1 hypothetical protein [Myxococcales bacterium]MCB9534056.1 hypothetical protein [Myxococcales bacterium]
MSNFPRGLCATALALAAAAMAAPTEARADDTASYDGAPLVYQRRAGDEAGAVAVAAEVAAGTRETRRLGPEGVELGARARYQPVSRLALEAWGAHTFEGEHTALSLEAIGGALRQESNAIDLDLGLGYLYDFEATHVIRGRVAIGRAFDAVHTEATALLELPLGEGEEEELELAEGADEERDTIDVVVAVAASYTLSPMFDVGVELAAEDLEGLFDEEEAEGGARFLLGPTVAARLTQGLFAKANLAAVRSAAGNQTLAAGEAAPSAWGMMTRVVVGWNLR